MTAAISVLFGNAAAEGRRAFLDLGTGNATIEVYGNARPASGATPGAAPLVVAVLAKPCGAVLSGALVLLQNDPSGELILLDGTATWARFKNGNGDWAFDCDVSLDGGSGEVQFPAVNLLAGGRAPLSPSYIG